MPDAEVLNRVPIWTPKPTKTIQHGSDAAPRPDETEVYAAVARTPEAELDEVARLSGVTENQFTIPISFYT
jgi:hypothetical protein